MSTAWLLDKSAFVRLAESPEAETWLDRINAGHVHISTLTLLELGFSARNLVDWESVLGLPPVASLLVEYLTPAMEDRAVEVQGLLAARGQHRAPSIPDLLIAATAEIADLTVLHLDKDFELIAEVTGQPVARVRMEL